MSTALTQPNAPQAAWIKDGDQWCVLVPPPLAKPGARVVVERATGTHRRVVTIRTVTGRTWRGRVICTIDHRRLSDGDNCH